MKVLNQRCMICNCTDSEHIATYDEEYKPQLKFTQNPFDERPGLVCNECISYVNMTVSADNHDDELEFDLLEEDWDD